MVYCREAKATLNIICKTHIYLGLTSAVLPANYGNSSERCVIISLWIWSTNAIIVSTSSCKCDMYHLYSLTLWNKSFSCPLMFSQLSPPPPAEHLLSTSHLVPPAVSSATLYSTSRQHKTYCATGYGLWIHVALYMKSSPEGWSLELQSCTGTNRSVKQLRHIKFSVQEPNCHNKRYLFLDSFLYAVLPQWTPNTATGERSPGHSIIHELALHFPPSPTLSLSSCSTVLLLLPKSQMAFWQYMSIAFSVCKLSCEDPVCHDLHYQGTVWTQAFCTVLMLCWKQ